MMKVLGNGAVHRSADDRAVLGGSGDTQDDMNFADIEALVRQGESEALEFKKSTGQLSRAAETLCGFLNRRGGTVLFGVSPAGEIVGQLVADATLQNVAQILRRFDPPAPVQIRRVRMRSSDHEILVLEAFEPWAEPLSSFRPRAGASRTRSHRMRTR